MTSTAAKRWVEAAKVLTQDPLAIVRCPALADGVLTVRDEVSKDDPGMMERYLVCQSCGARNVIRMHVQLGRGTQNR